MALNLSAETNIESGELGPDGTVVTKRPPEPPLSVVEMAKLFPQLEIIGFLGRGGMGAVYKARQPRLDRLVALKLLSPENQGDAQFAERFEREARALARLNHSKIVAVYDFGDVQGRYYLLMEFVDGLTLRQLLRTRRMAPEQALAIVPHICEALQYAHDQGIVHRDIKPENILIDQQGRVKIADFGIAKLLGPQREEQALTAGGQVVGTPHYMAPEQVEHPRTVDHRADIYSLGVVFYEMLTGELPLGRFPAPSSRSRGMKIDVRLDEVVLKALEKEPERRYQHASNVKTDVETIAAQPANGLAAIAPANSQSSQRPSRPRARSLAAAAVVILTLLAAGWFLLHDTAQRRLEKKVSYAAAQAISAAASPGETKLLTARTALRSVPKDTARAQKLLLEIVKKDTGTLRPGSLCYVYVYLGYIEDRATNREQAVSWYHKASGIMEADQWIRECAEYGLKEPLTWIRHLDEDAAPKRQAASPAASSNAAPADARLDAKVKFAARQASVQDIVQSLAQQAGLGYEWKKSFAQTDPLCRRWVNNVAIEGKPCREALDEILMPVGLRYQVEHDAIVLFRQ
jgi:serine/threonine protein kinase